MGLSIKSHGMWIGGSGYEGSESGVRMSRGGVTSLGVHAGGGGRTGLQGDVTGLGDGRTAAAASPCSSLGPVKQLEALGLLCPAASSLSSFSIQGMSVPLGGKSTNTTGPSI